MFPILVTAMLVLIAMPLCIVMVFVSIVFLTAMGGIRLVPSDHIVLDAQTSQRVTEFEALGFRKIGPVYHVASSMPGSLVALIDPRGLAFVTVFWLDDQEGNRTHAFDMISLLDNPPVGPGRPGITTSNNKSFGTGTAEKGSFRVAIVDGSPAEIARSHYESLEFLLSHGIDSIPLKAEDFARNFESSIADSQRFMRRNVIGYTLVMLYRMATGNVLIRRPLAEQPGALRGVEALLAARC